MICKLNPPVEVHPMMISSTPAATPQASNAAPDVEVCNALNENSTDKPRDDGAGATMTPVPVPPSVGITAPMLVGPVMEDKLTY